MLGPPRTPTLLCGATEPRPEPCFLERRSETCCPSFLSEKVSAAVVCRPLSPLGLPSSKVATRTEPSPRAATAKTPPRTAILRRPPRLRSLRPGPVDDERAWPDGRSA